MKILRVFDSLKFLRTIFVAVACTFILNVANAATLPAGYTELEYIESTGTQYIDTGITDIVNLKTELVAQLTSIQTTGFPTLIGAGLSGNTDYKVILGYHGTQFYSQSGNVSGYRYFGNLDTNKHTFIVDNGTDSQTITMDGTIYTSNYAITTDQTVPLAIFARKSSTAVGSYTNMKVWSVKFWHNGVLIQNLVPAKNSSGVVGMYDLMDSNPATAFHTNAGTGTFVAGPAVPIKIATTKYNEQQFAPVQNRLSDAMDAVDDVVTRTMTQAQAIDQIATNKQTRPDEGCTAKYCLLVEDEDGTPHWYPIAGANGVEYVLPAGYTKLEYLKKTEMSQYIQTNYIGNLKSRYEGAIYIGNDVSYWTRDAYYIASRETENGNTRNIALGGSSNGFYVGYGGFVSTNRFSLVQGKKVDFITDYVNRTWSVNIDGVAQTETISSNAIITSFVNTAPLQIFFVKPEDYPDDYVNYSSFPGVRVYYLRIYEDNSLVHEFIPVRRDSDGVLGMYDLADSNPATAFYTNAGTGEFVAGPDM